MREVAVLFGLNVDPSAENRELAFDLATLADRTGIDVVASQDHPYHRRHLDTWTLLTALAISTSRVKVLTNVANLPLRPPSVLAKSAASLALLTGGRVILGLGASAPTSTASTTGSKALGPDRCPTSRSRSGSARTGRACSPSLAAGPTAGHPRTASRHPTASARCRRR
jgi:alkanesulfonate monooxygenase SsuD/methylene tetrahydromethanopterin reductase-like flavin-dependent oxidoreductase (luciferase family)